MRTLQQSLCQEEAGLQRALDHRMTHSYSLALAEPTPRALLLGAAAGAAATIAMSGVMVIAQSSGLLGRSPPRHIVERVLDRLHVRNQISRGNRQLLTAVAHLGFGATQGALYAVLHQQWRGRYSGTPIAQSAATGVPFALCEIGR